MNMNEPSSSSLCARLYHVILEAFRNSISCTKDLQLMSKLQNCAQRYKIWTASFHIENGDLDAQLDQDADMKDSVLLLLGLILYDLYKIYQNLRPRIPASDSGSTIGLHDFSLPAAQSFQDFNKSILEKEESSTDLFQTFDSIAPNALHSRSLDQPHTEDYAHWIASLAYICPNLQSFVTDSDLEDINSLEPSDTDSEALITELVEDIADTVQQLYDLGPSLAWEVMIPKIENDSGSERQWQIGGEDSMEEGFIHYLRLTQDKFAHISNGLALRLAKANWIRFQRLETARNTVEAERILLASRKTRGESHADSGYHTGSKSGTRQGLDDIAQPQDEYNNLSKIGTEYGSVYSSLNEFGVHGRLRFPAPPMRHPGLDHGKVDCTVCGSTVGPFRNKQEWRLHVVRDLAPYVCPVLDCGSEQIIFDSQRLFTAHLRCHDDFSSSWRCRFSQCDMLFRELNSFQNHIQASHGISKGDDTEHLCKSWAESTATHQETSCPICNGIMNTSLVQRSKHLGRHMIELALMSIPNHSLDSDESEEDNFSQSNTSSELSLDRFEFMPEDKEGINAAESARKSTVEREIPIISGKAGVGNPSQAENATETKWKRKELGSQSSLQIDRSRPMSKEEVSVAHKFELHADDCARCQNPAKVLRRSESLCHVGHKHAQEVCGLLYNNADGWTVSTAEPEDELVRIDIPTGYFQLKSLLRAVERSARLSIPFVSVYRSYSGPPRSSEMLELPTEEEPLRFTPGDVPGLSKSSTDEYIYDKDVAQQEKAAINPDVEMREPDRRKISVKKVSGHLSDLTNKVLTQAGDTMDRRKTQVTSPKTQAPSEKKPRKPKRGDLYEDDVASQKKDRPKPSDTLPTKEIPFVEAGSKRISRSTKPPIITKGGTSNDPDTSTSASVIGYRH